MIPVSERFNDYAHQVNDQLLAAGLRGEADTGPDRVGYKIRSASLQKIPYVIVVGEKELDAGTINVRSRQAGELGAMTLDAFLESLAEERKPRGRPPTPPRPEPIEAAAAQ